MTACAYTAGVIFVAEVESDIDPGVWVDLAERGSELQAVEVCSAHQRRQRQQRRYRVRRFDHAATIDITV